eukprot:gene33054-38321_t
MFWPEIGGARFDHGALIGLLCAVGGTLSFSCGNMVSARLQRDRVPVIAASAWGMIYGTILLTIGSLALGKHFAFEPTIGYAGSLVYLAVISSGIAFWAYLTLLGRIGSARAGYATVMFPVFALIISTLLENYHWTLPSIAGLCLALAGNVLVLRGGAAR